MQRKEKELAVIRSQLTEERNQNTRERDEMGEAIRKQITGMREFSRECAAKLDEKQTQLSELKTEVEKIKREKDNQVYVQLWIDFDKILLNFSQRPK